MAMLGIGASARPGKLLHALILGVAVMMSALPLMAAPTFPSLTGRVVDNANLLSEAQEAALVEQLSALETKTSDQLVVVTLPDLQGYTIEDFGYQLGRHWAIGQKDKNNGVLLIVAPQERKVRIEVGYGLEGTLTDALTRTIIETAIIPRFKAGDMPGGIAAAVSDIVTVLSGDAEAVANRAVGDTDTSEKWLIGLFFLLWAILFFTPIILHFIDPKSAMSGRKGSGSSHSWSGGSWSSGSSGGGFSGGGGSFGGGGSSGSW